MSCNVLDFASSNMQQAWQQVVDAPRAACDYLTRVVKDADALNNATKLISTIVEIANRYLPVSVFKEFGDTCRSASDLISARSFVGGIQELVSGDAAWKKPIAQDIPNVIRVASRAFILVSNLARTTGWLINQGFINAAAIATAAQAFMANTGLSSLASIAAETGIAPFFGVLGNMSLKAIQDQTGVIGFAIDLIDVSRQIGISGFNTDTWIMIASDVGKIGAIMLAGSSVPTWALVGLVAAATASAAYLIKHFKTEYKL